MKLKVFQKGFNYSQDGRGNRLVWHLQGCNMHCPWCANPEGMPPEGVLMTDPEQLAVSCCPRGAVKRVAAVCDVNDVRQDPGADGLATVGFGAQENCKDRLTLDRNVCAACTERRLHRAHPWNLCEFPGPVARHPGGHYQAVGSVFHGAGRIEIERVTFSSGFGRNPVRSALGFQEGKNSIKE